MILLRIGDMYEHLDICTEEDGGFSITIQRQPSFWERIVWVVTRCPIRLVTPVTPDRMWQLRDILNRM